MATWFSTTCHENRRQRIPRAGNLKKSFQNNGVKIIFLANLQHFTLRHSHQKGLSGLQPVCPIRLCAPTICRTQYCWRNATRLTANCFPTRKIFWTGGVFSARKIIIMYKCTSLLRLFFFFPGHTSFFVSRTPLSPQHSFLPLSHSLVVHAVQHATLVQYLCLGINGK